MNQCLKPPHPQSVEELLQSDPSLASRITKCPPGPRPLEVILSEGEVKPFYLSHGDGGMIPRRSSRYSVK